MSHSASLATSRVVQHRTTLRSMWSPWVDNLSERPCCDGGLTSSAPIAYRGWLATSHREKGTKQTTPNWILGRVHFTVAISPAFFFGRLHRDACGVMAMRARCLNCCHVQ